MLYSRQVRGIIAVAILLAVIPFFAFVSESSPDLQGPEYSMSGDHKFAVEFVDESKNAGIYFIDPGTSLRQWAGGFNPDINISDDFELENGMSVKMIEKNGITTCERGRVPAEKRIALGLPLDVNRATLEELMLVPGVGASTAQKIISYRSEIGNFRELDQLLAIKGIKEKKLKQLFPYLYLE